MAQFMYNVMTRTKGTDIYIAPNHYQDVKDIHKANCPLCDKDALVQDVINWEKSLEYLYKCQVGHNFHVMYFKLKEYEESKKGRSRARKEELIKGA